MSRWSRGYSQTLEAPKDGHNVKRALAETWWAKQWISALEQVLDGSAGRLARGRTYARTGRVSKVNVVGSKVTARVKGTRVYSINIMVGQLSNAEWTQVLAAMAQQAQYSAALLSGHIPSQTPELFRSLGVALLPTTRAGIQTSCSCPDWGDPCKHVAAVHYVLAEALDVDPFLLFELRGRNKAQVLAAMNQARNPVAPSPTPGRTKRAVSKAGKAGQASGSPEPAPAWREDDYDKLPAPLPAIHFSFGNDHQREHSLCQLGTPAGWPTGQSPSERFAPLLKATAEFARAVAAAETEDIESLVENANATRGRSLKMRKSQSPAVRRPRS